MFHYRQLDLFHIIISLVALCVFVSCSETGTSPSTGTTAALGGEGVTVSVDADKAYSDRPVTFTVRCAPLVSGKGRILFDAYGDYVGSKMYVESPVTATLIRDSMSVIPIPATFVANEPFAMGIRCRLQPGVSYFYYATVMLDSVYVADSSRYFGANSEVGRKLSGARNGYVTQVTNKGGTMALYRP